MPVQLTFSVVGVAMKGTHHHAEAKVNHLRRQRTVTQRLGERTSDIVSTTSIGSVNTKEFVNERQGIFGPGGQVNNTQIKTKLTYSSPLRIISHAKSTNRWRQAAMNIPD